MAGERTVSSTLPRFHAVTIPNRHPSAKLISTAIPPSIMDQPMPCPMISETDVGKC